MMRELLFEHTVPQSVIVAGLIAAVLFGGFCFWRYLPAASGKFVLGALRLLFYVVLGWCLFRPMQKRQDNEQLRPRFLVIEDTSASMNLTPKEGIPTRWSVVKEILKQPWTADIPRKAEVDGYSFDTTSSSKISLKELTALNAKGSETRLRDSLQQIADRYRGQPLAGILLLTDGVDTRELGDDWAAGSWPAPIYTVRLEPPNSWEETPDARVLRVDTPHRVVVGWQSELTAVVGATGAKGVPLNVQLYENDKLLQEIPTQVPASGGNTEVKFELDHKQVGSFVYKVKIPKLPGEIVLEDNELSVAVQVTDSKNRVLYVEGTPQFEFKFLKRALERTKEISPIILVQGPDGNLMSVGYSGKVNLTMAADQLAQFKIVILGNLDAKTLGDERAKALVKFVDSGGSLILLGGQAAWGAEGFAATPLQQLMPVKREGFPAPLEGKFNVVLTDEGKTHPALQNITRKWTKAMPVLSVFPGATVSAGATAVMSADNQPLIVTQRFGQGKVAAILSNSLWRWQLEPGQKDEFLTLWSGLTQWLMPQASQVDAYTLDLAGDADQIFLGDSLALTARLGGASAGNVGKVAATVEISTPDGRKIPFPMAQSISPGVAGKNVSVFAAKYKSDVGALHTAVASAMIEGRKIESPPFSFFVKPFTPETSPRPQNVAVLKMLSQSSGGQFCEKDQLNDVLTKIDIKTSEERRVSYASLWDSPILLTALMLLLAADWIFRKTKNMP